MHRMLLLRRSPAATPTTHPGRRPALVAAVAGLSLLALSFDARAALAPDSFADLGAKVTPAVVNISSTHEIDASGRGAPEQPFNFPKGSPYEEFFRRFQDKTQPENRQGGRHQATALGSGFIIDSSGYVVTNNHVIAEATEVQVTLTDGRQFPAEVVGADPKTDLALLKIDAPTPLPTVSFGGSDAVRVGDWVVAVGNPFGLGGTVTAGIVSARGRDIQAGPFDDFLQIDAAVNQGNSGGPAFGIDGKVIGITTAIFSPNGGSVGIGFAIPANLAKPVIAQLREHGVVERGWLGVQVQAVTPEIAAAVGLDKPSGALVSGVQLDGPAARAALRQGDIIIGYDGAKVAEMRDLPRLVAATPAGKTVELRIWRDGAELTAATEIAKLQAQDRVAAIETEPAGPVGAVSSKTLGLSLAAATPELRQRYGLADTVAGVVVVGVDADGPAAEQGLRPGDVIERVAAMEVSVPAQVEAAADAARAANRPALLLVNRDGNELFVAVKVA